MSHLTITSLSHQGLGFTTRGHTHGQPAREKVSHVANYKKNPNQNYNEVSPQTSHNGHHLKNLQTTNAGEDVEKREPSYTVGGNVN